MDMRRILAAVSILAAYLLFAESKTCYWSQIYEGGQFKWSLDVDHNSLCTSYQIGGVSGVIPGHSTQLDATTNTNTKRTNEHEISTEAETQGTNGFQTTDHAKNEQVNELHTTFDTGKQQTNELHTTVDTETQQTNEPHPTTDAEIQRTNEPQVVPETETHQTKKFQTTSDTETKRTNELHTTADTETQPTKELKTTIETETQRATTLQTPTETNTQRTNEPQVLPETETENKFQTTSDTEAKQTNELHTTADTAETQATNELQTTTETETQRRNELHTEAQRTNEWHTTTNTETQRTEELHNVPDTGSKAVTDTDYRVTSGQSNTVCPLAMVHDYCTCLSTCADLLWTSSCYYDCLESNDCFCPAGSTGESSGCLSPSDCPCYWPEANLVIPVNQSYVSTDCTEMIACDKQGLNTTWNHCSPNSSCTVNDGVRQCSCNDGFSGDGQICEIYKDCYDAYTAGHTQDGKYVILPVNWTELPFEVYCNMNNSNNAGGWTVFQRRGDHGTDFNRSWISYRDGFGSLQGEFWIGNEKLFYLTRQREYSLHVRIVTADNRTIHREYSHFFIGPESDNYRLRVADSKVTFGTKEYAWSGAVLACIRDNNDKKLSNIKTLEACQQRCEDETSFVCLSIDYHDPGKCKLSSVNSYSVDPVPDYVQPCWAFPDNVQYSERHEKADPMIHVNGSAFGTWDRDSDGCAGYRCNNEDRGGWWHANCIRTDPNQCREFVYGECIISSLNGEYSGRDADGSDHCYLMATEMMIRPSSGSDQPGV